MATSQDIVTEARKLGQLIADHPAAQKLEAVLKQLDQDVEAQRILADYNRQLQKIAEKEQAGQPIEVEDKQAAEQFRNKLIRNPVLRDMQVAQMDYVDLMRQVDQAIAGQTPTHSPTHSTAGAASSPPPLSE